MDPTDAFALRRRGEAKRLARDFVPWRRRRRKTWEIHGKSLGNGGISMGTSWKIHENPVEMVSFIGKSMENAGKSPC